jgi:putative acyl-CoA dehydrogenase
MNLHQFAETHEVTNQPPSLDGANLYRIDLPLQEWSRRFGAGWASRGSMPTVRWPAGR